MTKKMVETILSSVKYDIDGHTLEEVLHKIKQWIQEYGGKTKFEIGEHYEDYENSPTQHVRLVGIREESDKVYEKRIAWEEECKVEQEKRDKADFERLQKKFGSKP